MGEAAVALCCAKAEKNDWVRRAWSPLLLLCIRACAGYLLLPHTASF